MSLPVIPVVHTIDPQERAVREREDSRAAWHAIMVRDAAERRRKANMLCRRGHVWTAQGPMFLCGRSPSVSYWRECSRCGMTQGERPGPGPHAKRRAAS